METKHGMTHDVLESNNERQMSSLGRKVPARELIMTEL